MKALQFEKVADVSRLLFRLGSGTPCGTPFYIVESVVPHLVFSPVQTYAPVAKKA